MIYRSSFSPKLFELVYNMKQDNLIPQPFAPSAQEKLMYEAAGMSVTKHRIALNFMANTAKLRGIAAVHPHPPSRCTRLFRDVLLLGL
jgi:hypothetical protein